MDNDVNFIQEVSKLREQIGMLCHGKDTEVVLWALAWDAATVISETSTPSLTEDFYKQTINKLVDKMLKNMERANKIKQDKYKLL